MISDPAEGGFSGVIVYLVSLRDGQRCDCVSEQWVSEGAAFKLLKVAIEAETNKKGY